MTIQKMNTLNPYCALCNEAVPCSLANGESKLFCCIGCRTVYQILEARKELDEFQTHPLFQQALQSGMISNPALLEQFQTNQPQFQKNEIQRLHLEIQDLWCPSCAEIIRLFLLKEKGVNFCAVDYSTDLAVIEYSARYLSKENILDCIRSIGYRPRELSSQDTEASRSGINFRFIVAAFFSLNVMMFSYPVYASYFSNDLNSDHQIFIWLQFFASLPILFYSAVPIVKRFFTSFSFGFMGMESLVVLGVSAAFGLSLYELLTGGKHVYFDAMSVIITFVLLGKIIESRAKFSAKATFQRLARAMPKKGRKRFSDGSEQFLNLKEIRKGDLLVALTGEKIVLDGCVVEGEGSCDESLMTGEAFPVKKASGDMVLSGTVLCQGRICYRIETDVDETALHHIITVIEQDLINKGRNFRAIDPFIRYFVPIVVAISMASALGTWLSSESLQSALLRAISILLISCPCALGIAAPLAEAQILHRMAKLGAIVRNRGCLSVLGREDVFIFDKTGTVTEGRFVVISGIDPLPIPKKQILKAMAGCSIHPICQAITMNIKYSAASLNSCKEVAGKGLEGSSGGVDYFLGSKEYLQSRGAPLFCQHEHFSRCGTEVFFSEGEKPLALIVLGDQIRKEAPSTIQLLKPAQTILLSGDREKSVEVVAKQCGFDQWQASLSPIQKKAFIDALRKQGKCVAMLGDGINDAPALTTADVGISVITATDISVQVSDVMLTTGSLKVLAKIRTLARKGRAVLYQNLFWAFFYNIIGMGLAIGGYLNPLISASSMVLSSLFVIFNAKRIR